MSQKTTADLIVRHTEKHLTAITPATVRPVGLGLGLFLLAGVAAILLVLELANFHAADTQKVANSATAAVHAAATASTAGQTFGALGIILTLAVIHLVHEEYGILTRARPHFLVRKIRGGVR